MTADCPDQAKLDAIFPPERADAFFDALYGGAEEGAYDIRLVCRNVSEKNAQFVFELACRPGQCLRCNLTYGLPQVFQRHPIIDAAGTAQKLAQLLGWSGPVNWRLGATEEYSPEKHFIPLIIERS